jgi:dipeptidyl aminopeptidase/acylaminoacyl peptidase
MYGADPYVSAQQSQSMARALSGAGKDVTGVTLPQDREWRARTASRVQVMQELEKFLGQHLQRN